MHLPPGITNRDSGRDAVDLARSAGLILDDWQQWTLTEALAERADLKWAAFECAVLVPRQNGKGSILEALELAGLFVFGMRLIVHSAHEFKTAREHFLRMQSLIRGAPELDAQVAYMHTGSGSESIGLKSGARLNFVARSRGSGRGFSGDLVVFDEAFKLPEEAVGAMLPALSAMPNPQVWYTSSAPHADSHVLHGLRNRALQGDSGRLFFAEWGNDPDVDPRDQTARARANPGFNIRISAEHCDAEYDAMGHLGNEFLRERMGVPEQQDTTSGIFPPGLWEACRDPESKVDVLRAISLDVSPGMMFGSFGLAGKRADGLDHVELETRRTGTDWIVERAKYLTEKYALPLMVDPASPTAGILDELIAAGIKIEEMKAGALAKACATLQERVLSGTVRHIGQPILDAAVAGAAIRIQGDAWRWGRTASSVDISPLVAITVALSADPTLPASTYWSSDEL